MSQIRVLLVDDEEELVSTLKERLEWRGIAAEAVTSGRSALQLMENSTFDVIVIDLKMPDLDGLEVRDIIHRRYPGVQILMITGHGHNQGEEQVVAEGASDVLLKPFNIDTLIEKIHQKLND
jgi:CheY-like chemotaxis protein